MTPFVEMKTELFLVDDEETARLRLAGSNGKTQFKSFQTGFLRKTDALDGVFVLERASEMAKKWTTSLFLAQLDLKKAFDHVQHSFATTALQQKVVSEQLLSVLNKWWTQSDVEVSLAGITSDKRISLQTRKEPQSRLQIFVAVSDYVLGNLDAGWRNRNIGWKMDNIHLTSIAYDDAICLLASSKKDLEHRWFTGYKLGNGIGQNLLDQHNTLSGRHSER